MAGGLAALLDDVATMAKLAAASVDDVTAAAGRASVKAAGVGIDFHLRFTELDVRSELAIARFLDDWLSRLDGVLTDRIHDFRQAQP